MAFRIFDCLCGIAALCMTGAMLAHVWGWHPLAGIGVWMTIDFARCLERDRRNAALMGSRLWGRHGR